MAKKVVVHDVDTLDRYCKQLSDLRTEILENSRELDALSEELRAKSTEMSSITEAQSTNWRDPQYERMKGAVTPCMVAISINANSMNDTARFISQQMEKVESSVQYIRALVRKLRS